MEIIQKKIMTTKIEFNKEDKEALARVANILLQLDDIGNEDVVEAIPDFYDKDGIGLTVISPYEFNYYGTSEILQVLARHSNN